MRCERTDLVNLQQLVAERRIHKLAELRRSIAQRASDTLPDRPLEDGEFYWHPKFRLALRVYNSGRGIWVYKYRNKRGLERTHKIGNAANLNTTVAEKAATQIQARVALGEDPQGERAELRARPQITVGALCEQFFEEMRASPKNSFRTVAGYASIARLYLGALRNMQADELDSQAVVVRVRELAKQSTFNASRFRAMLSAVYEWAMQVYPKTIVLNPVSGTWQPERKASTGQALTMEQLGAIWRACEMLDGMAEPMCRNGHVMNRFRKLEGADDELVGVRQAAELAGFDNKTLYKAARNGTLALHRVRSRAAARDIPRYDPTRPGAKPTNYTTVGEINRYIDARAMRSQRGDYSKVVRLAMLFGARYREMSELRWSEINLDKRILHIKTVPDNAPVGHRRIKSRGGKPKDLILYIPDPAAEIIRSVPKQGNREMLFGSGKHGALANGDLKRDLDDIIARNEGASFKWKHHWMRHAFTTRLKEIGVQPYLIEAITNHKLKGELAILTETEISSLYTHTKYLNLQKSVLDKWAQLIRDAADRVPASDTSKVYRLSFGPPAAETA